MWRAIVDSAFPAPEDDVPAPNDSPAVPVADEPGRRPGVIKVVGEMDLDTSDPLRGRVDRALGQHVHLVLDLSGVTFADSTFLNTLLRARQKALERGGSVSLLAPSDSVRHLLRLTGAAALFPVVTADELDEL
jgi:anti-anti-sigma factor